MEPRQAWNAVLLQLQMEMPRATFDKWVCETVFVDFEDDVFRVGVRNAYARDWLESRLTSTVKRHLTGILKQSVPVQFLTLENMPPVPSVDENAEDDLDEIVTFYPKYDTVLSEILQSKRVVRINAYLLRHLPYLGANATSIYMALYQAGYLMQTGNSVKMSGAEVARWGGIGKRTYWREMDRNPYLANLIQHAQPHNPAGHPVDAKGRVYLPGRGKANSPQRTANTYTLTIDLPLTPADAASLAEWLVDNGIKDDWVAALSAALETPAVDIIPDEWYRGCPKADQTAIPVSVPEVVRSLVAVDPEDTAHFETLVNQLRNHLIPDTDVLLPSWHFLHHWLPLLGADKGWALLYLRSLAYYSSRDSVLRTLVRVRGGWTRLAWMLRLTPETISRWFSDDNISWMRMFVDIQTQRKRADNTVDMWLHVEPRELVAPVFIGQALTGLGVNLVTVSQSDGYFVVVVEDDNIQIHEIAKSAYMTVIRELRQTEAVCYRPPLSSEAGLDVSFWRLTDATPAGVGAFLAQKKNEGGRVFGTITKGVSAFLAQKRGGGGRESGTLEGEGGRVFGTILKVLIKSSSGVIEAPPPNTVQPKTLVGAAFDQHLKSGWHLDTLLSTVGSAVKRNELRALVPHGLTAEMWVAWLLDSAANIKKLQFKGAAGDIVAMTISELLSQGDAPDFPAFDYYRTLAELPPLRLAGLILHALLPERNISPMACQAWEASVGKYARQEQLQQLAVHLLHIYPANLESLLVAAEEGSDHV